MPPLPKQGKKKSIRQTSGYKWEKVRQRILRRDSRLCVPCWKKKRATVAMEVDHIVPIHKGGTDNDDNLQSICKECHEEKTNIDLGRETKKSKCGIDGYPLDENHPWNKEANA